MGIVGATSFTVIAPWILLTTSVLSFLYGEHCINKTLLHKHSILVVFYFEYTWKKKFWFLNKCDLNTFLFYLSFLSFCPSESFGNHALSLLFTVFSLSNCFLKSLRLHNLNLVVVWMQKSTRKQFIFSFSQLMYFTYFKSFMYFFHIH